MDLYSKTVFTVIAAALCAIVLENTGNVPALASQDTGLMKVMICGQDARELFREKITCAKVHPDLGLLVRERGPDAQSEVGLRIGK